MNLSAYAAFVRGINVGGKNRIAMAELRAAFEELGAVEPRTYIQSGNVVFRSSTTQAKRLPGVFSKWGAGRFTTLPHMEIRTYSELELVLENNPFASVSQDLKTVHVFFLECTPEDSLHEKLNQRRSASEQSHANGRQLYLYAPDGIARSKFAQSVEKDLGVRATARNLRTVAQVFSMMDD